MWNPNVMTPIEGDAAQSLLKMIDALEDNDDVQTVTGNFDIPEADLEKFANS